MRQILVLALITVLAAGSALAATPQQEVMKSCSAKWSAMSAADKGKTKRTAFMSTCMKAPATSAAAAAPAMAMKPAASGSMAMKPAAAGTMAMKPAAAGSMAMKPAAAGSMAMTAKPAGGSMAMKPAAATGGQAKCKDGVTVTYKNRQGTCSGHGGVATWM